MRRFHLIRTEDVTGTSGTGQIAEGVETSSDKVLMEWTCEPASSVCVYASLEDLLKIHGHEGRTTIEWLDKATPELVECLNGLHEPQVCDEDGLDDLAVRNGLSYGEVEKVAYRIRNEGLTSREAIGRVVDEARLI